jgi:hypothetical protein
MVKFLRLSGFVGYSLLCFGVAAYAFYYMFQYISSYNYIAIKFAQSGLEIPAHFFGAGLSLLLVPFQLSKKLRSFSLKIHKTTGLLYFLAVLFGGISGFIMSFNATGGALAEWGFRMMAIVWLLTTIIAVWHAINGNIALHKKWIYRSIAMTSAAITFRLYLGLGLGVLDLPFMTVYISISWLSWVLNLAVCEIILYQRQRQYHQRLPVAVA